MPKTVVITGGTKGIGRGLAENFLKRGHNVVVASRSADAAAEADLKDHATAGAGVKSVACDVADAASVQALWDAAMNTFGKVDIWVNNAGVSNAMHDLEDLPMSEIPFVYRINLEGVANCCHVAITGMQKQGFGQIWNMEGFGSNGMKRPGMTLYGASKRAITYFTDSLVKEQKAKGSPVQVCHLSPGIVVTDMVLKDIRDLPDDEREKKKRIYNILADKPETVTEYLVDGILKTEKSGARVAWLTNGKVFGRFLTARFKKRDVFEGTGV